MKKMVCEICGSQNLRKDNGVFKCQECGSEYSIEEAKKLLVEVENDIVKGDIEKKIAPTSNIDSLIETGKKIIAQIPIDSSQISLLNNIKEKILLEDYENIYGKLFECLIECNAGSPHNLHITSLIERNDEKINEIIFSSLFYYLKSSLSSLFTITNDDMLYYQIKLVETKFLGFIGPLFKYRDQIPENIKNEFDSYLIGVQQQSEKVIKYVYEQVSHFVFTESSVKAFEFTNKFRDLIMNSYLFVNSIRKYIDCENIDRDCNGIFSIIKNNSNIILNNEPIMGKLILEYAGKLASKEKEVEALFDSSCNIVNDCWCANNRIVLKLYRKKAVVTGVGPERVINKEDILKLNCKVAVHSEGTTLWWDIVYKLNQSTYTVLHFGYDLKITESISDCKQWSQIYNWSADMNIDLGQEQYESGNPFIHGIGRYSYVDTITQYTPKNAGKSGCYVATCVYGSYDCPEVWRLRRYRDEYLDAHWWGRLFIKLYYAISPTMVKLFGKQKWFKNPIKKILDKKNEKLAKKGYDDKPYNDKY